MKEFILLTNSDGRKMRVNIAQIEVNYRLNRGVTRVTISGTDYAVDEMPEEIDDLIRSCNGTVILESNTNEIAQC